MLDRKWINPEQAIAVKTPMAAATNAAPAAAKKPPMRKMGR